MALYSEVSGIDSYRLALGCMNFGGTWEPGESVSKHAYTKSRQALEAALELGWNFFDHADIYGRGRSEVVFGRLMKELGIERTSIYLQTKCGICFADDPTPGYPHRYDLSPEHIRFSVEGSLRRLQTDYIDILLLHRPDLLMEPEAILPELERLKVEGKVRNFGVSNFPPFLLQRFREAGFLPIANQVEISLLKPALVESMLVAQDYQPTVGHPADGTLEWHARFGVVTQAWAPLAYGYLSGRTQSPSEKRVMEGARLVDKLSKEKSVAPEAIVIAWLLRHPSRIQPIVGTMDPTRLRACDEALRCELSREEWYALHRAVRGAPLA